MSAFAEYIVNDFQETYKFCQQTEKTVFRVNKFKPKYPVEEIALNLTLNATKKATEEIEQETAMQNIEGITRH